MKKITIKENEVINGLKFIRDADPFVDPNGRQRTAALFECHCGKVFKTRVSDVRSKKTASCGCAKGILPKFYEENSYINGVKFLKSLGTRSVGAKGQAMQYGLFECPYCKREWESIIANIKGGSTKSCCESSCGFPMSAWIGKFKKIYLYKVRLFNDKESFIKIGITGHENIKKRMSFIPYNYEIIKIIHNDTEFIFRLEKRLNRIFKNSKYNPLKKFGGDSECFQLKQKNKIKWI